MPQVSYAGSMLTSAQYGITQAQDQLEDAASSMVTMPTGTSSSTNSNADTVLISELSTQGLQSAALQSVEAEYNHLVSTALVSPSKEAFASMLDIVTRFER